MSEAGQTRRLWYTRRDGVVRGPYPEPQITRYILLGRIRDADELCPVDGAWAALSRYPDLIPDVMQLPPTRENLRKLIQARMREDERRPRDRRQRSERPRGVRERRAGRERRCPENDEMLRYRELRYRIFCRPRADGDQYCYPMGLVALVMLGFVLSYLLGQTQADQSTPDCLAGPAPRVNWDGCDLSGRVSRNANLSAARIRNAQLAAVDLRGAVLAGADLQYSTISFGDLRGVDLSHASLVGVAARGADLRRARLRHANLAYANLGGAQLDGADLSDADLSNAIWIDDTLCIAGSVGVCRRAQSGGAAGSVLLPAQVGLNGTDGRGDQP